MKVVVLASGSKGNVTYVEHNDTRILLDIGKSCNYVEKALTDIGVEPSSINAILITHTHIDHVEGMRVFYKRYKPKVYIMPKMYKYLNDCVDDDSYVYYEEEIMIGNIKVNIIKTSHDVEASVGFLINDNLVYITDTGYINQKYIPMLSNKTMYIMESNHDIEMLYTGGYPYHLKMRIASDVGHLSNIDSAKYLSNMIGINTKRIVLAHLSKENNTKELALETLLNTLDSNSTIEIVIAKQDERTQVFEI